MSFAELKEKVYGLSEDERLELQALLIHLDCKDDPAYKAEMSRRMAEMDAGKKHTKEDLERVNRELLAKGR
jgi:hypothetical protein